MVELANFGEDIALAILICCGCIVDLEDGTGLYLVLLLVMTYLSVVYRGRVGFSGRCRSIDIYG